jgi:hypothetical protein
MQSRILLAALVLVAACGKSTTSPSPNGGTPGGTSNNGNGSTLSAVIDGATWNKPNVTARYSTANPPYLEVDSIDSANNLFGFLIRRFGTNTGDLTPGTYEIGPTNSNANFITVGGTPTWTASPGVAGIAAKGSGSVVLTAFSKTAKTASGTFSFVLAGTSSTKTVTNGVFNVTFN